MRAITLQASGPPEALQPAEIAEPQPEPGEVGGRAGKIVLEL